VITRLRRGLRRDKRGQFLILTTLGIVVLMVTVSALLAYTAVSPVYFSKTNFREMTTELNLNFHKALAIALADASKELEHKASTVRYVNFTKMGDYPEAGKKGLEFMTKWLNITLMKYAGLGINVTISAPVFQCDWSSSEGYSRAEANMTLDILSYGFYGWKTRAAVETRPTILGLKGTDGNCSSLYFTVKREFGIPISDLTLSDINVLLQKTSGTFRTAVPIEITYFGGGNYLLKYYTNWIPILEALELLKTYIMELGHDAFKNPWSPETLCLKVDAVINQYIVENLNGTYQKLLQDVRAHLDTTTNQTWVYDYVDTSRELALIDDILSQLLPKIKLILNDSRGITVSAYSQITELSEDTIGPYTVAPSILEVTIGSNSINLTAQINDHRSNILSAEYFIGARGFAGTGIPMAPVDGAFDFSKEEVWAQINIAGWPLGSYTIYIHGQDECGNWGAFASVTLRVIEPQMHIKSITIRTYTQGKNLYVYVEVAIVDKGGTPVSYAEVQGSWEGPIRAPYVTSASTNTQGLATLWARTSGPGTITFRVTNIIRTNWQYDENANEVPPYISITI